MVRTDLTELGTLADLSQFSFSVDISRNDGDRAQVQEQIPTHSVPSVRVWDGPRFLHGETPRKPLHAFTGSSQTTEIGQRRRVTRPLVRAPLGRACWPKTRLGS